MRLLSPLLRQVVYPGLRSAGCFRLGSTSLPTVITYHGVAPDDSWANSEIPDGPLLNAQTLRRQLRVLKNNYYPISPEQFLAWIKDGEPLPDRAVLLTCDDGLLNHRTAFLPILCDENLQCIFFVTARSAEERPSLLWHVELYLLLLAARKSRLRIEFGGETWEEPLGNPTERRNTWSRLIERLSGHDEPYRRSWLQQAEGELDLENFIEEYLESHDLWKRFALMGREDLKALVQAGMTVGAHTLSHPLLMKQCGSAARAEIRDSRRILADALGVPVWSMAYPFGHAGSATERDFSLAQQAGYACAFLNCGGPVLNDSHPFALPRVHITAEMHISEFEAHVSGFHWRLQKSLRRA